MPLPAGVMGGSPGARAGNLRLSTLAPRGPTNTRTTGTPPFHGPADRSPYDGPRKPIPLITQRNTHNPYAAHPMGPTGRNTQLTPRAGLVPAPATPPPGTVPPGNHTLLTLVGVTADQLTPSRPRSLGRVLTAPSQMIAWPAPMIKSASQIPSPPATFPRGSPRHVACKAFA